MTSQGQSAVAEPAPGLSRRRGDLIQFLLRYGIVFALIALAAVFAWRSPV